MSSDRKLNVSSKRRTDLTESELYRELGKLTKEKERWPESVSYLSTLLTHESTKIKAKAIWMLGEIGLVYPHLIQNVVPSIYTFCRSTEPLLRERAVNALGRIGRGCFSNIEMYWKDLFCFSEDADPKVRLSFIWASENIATNTPDIYAEHMPVFAKLLKDENDKVRMEAPEIFRVLGKRRPEFVRPYLPELQNLSETDENRVVRIHASGAIRAAGLF